VRLLCAPFCSCVLVLALSAKLRRDGQTAHIESHFLPLFLAVAVAYIANGYVYHTVLDSYERIAQVPYRGRDVDFARSTQSASFTGFVSRFDAQGALQRCGENVLATTRYGASEGAQLNLTPLFDAAC
jgi:hypothetical protein